MMRPDEQANQADVVRDQKMRQGVKEGVGAVTGIASGAVSARILPLLSSYVPVELAMKGLSKISPKIADFLKRGQNAGLDIKEGMEYVKENLLSNKEEQQENAQEKRNPIEMHSPELHQFIVNQIKNGKTPLQAAEMATKGTNKGKFDSIIKKITDQHKTNWADILEAVYGGGKTANNAGNVAQNPANMTGNAQPQQVAPQQGQNGQMGQPQQQSEWGGIKDELKDFMNL